MREASARATEAGPCEPWGLPASLAWGIGALAAWLFAQVLIGELLGAWLDGGSLPDAPEAVAAHAPFVSAVTIGAAAVPLAVLALAVRLAGCTPAGYLGLRLPERRYLLIGLAALAVLIPLVDLLSWLADYAVTPQFVLDLYRTARDTGTILLLFLAIAVAAPVVEETIFRGFLLPGLAGSVLGVPGALFATSLVWALLHAQYQPFYLIQIVALGIVFGWLRLRSGSTLLTILLHGLLNLAALAQAAITVEGMA